MDFKFANNAALARLFTIWDLSGYRESSYDNSAQARVSTHHSLWSKAGFSAVVYPEVNYNFGNGLDLGAGLLLQLGKT